MKAILSEQLSKALESVDFGVPVDWKAVPYVVEWSKHAQHGHLTCNVALILARILAQSPRQIADTLQSVCESLSDIDRVEVAGPGFLNFFLSSKALVRSIDLILKAPERYGSCDIGRGQRVYLEYVSSNPTGPLHVGHGRSGAIGSTLARLLRTGGYTVEEAYYVNDAGRQMRVLGLSCLIRAFQHTGQACVLPSTCYQGEYLKVIAAQWVTEKSSKSVLQNSEILACFKESCPDSDQALDRLIEHVEALMGEARFQALYQYTSGMILDDIRDDLSEFGVKPVWFSEQSLYDEGAVETLLADLQTRGHVEMREGALWFKATAFGDEKDRVLKRANGQFTYFAADAAYHRLKLKQFDQMIDIWGSDHHGYVGRMMAVLDALGEDVNRLKCLLVQFVNLVQGSQRVSMSTRAGSFITLRQLREDVGTDVCRFFYLMRKFDQHMDFDLDLARTQSQDNPVYYVQYAHARICSIFDQSGDSNVLHGQNISLSQLGDQAESLLCLLAQYPEVIMSCVKLYEVHSLVFYLQDLASLLHRYYNTEQCLVEDDCVRTSRLALLASVRHILAKGLALLGVKAPERM